MVVGKKEYLAAQGGTSYDRGVTKLGSLAPGF